MAEEKLYKELEVRELDKKKRKTRVCIIYTGGTIGMVPKDPNNPSSPNLKPASLDELLDAVPGLGVNEGIELGLVSFKKPVDSSDISSKHWIAMADAIEDNYDDFQGFVILHGTDTMAYTTSALSFLLDNLAKPVVVTGSQLPIKAPRTDGVQNLTSAIYIAGYKAVGLPKVSEVVLCFANLILRGNRATKVSSTQWQGFTSPNFPPLGTIGEHIKIREDLLLKAPDTEKFEFSVRRDLADDIRIILVNPGMTPTQIERDIKTEGLEGVILMTYGAGNMPTSKEIIEIITEAVEGGKGYSKPIVILNVTQCVEGMVEMGLYEASGGLLEAGATSGLDLTFEAALGKMYWALRKFKGREIHSQLQVAHRGEQSLNLSDLYFEIEKAKTKSSATEKILPKDQHIPGKYDRNKLSTAILRIQGIGYNVDKFDDSASIRIFINSPSADHNTSIRDSSFATEIDLKEIPDSGNIIRDVTKTARNIVKTGQPVYISIIGINTNIWCKSVLLSLYTDAR